MNANRAKRDLEPKAIPRVENAYKAAIDATRAAVTWRSKSYRALVIVMLLTFVGVSFSALKMWSFFPLTGLILLVPACQAFFWFDARLVANWRRRVLAWWSEEQLALGLARETLSNVPGLPRTTLAAMLATLPSQAAFGSQNKLSQPVKEAFGYAMNALEAQTSVRMLKGTLMTLVAGATLLTLGFTRSWIGLVPLALIPAVAALAAGANRFRWRSLRRSLVAMQLTSDDSRVLLYALKAHGSSAVSQTELNRLAKALD
jgi:hypothetical protein